MAALSEGNTHAQTCAASPKTPMYYVIRGRQDKRWKELGSIQIKNVHSPMWCAFCAFVASFFVASFFVASFFVASFFVASFFVAYFFVASFFVASRLILAHYGYKSPSGANNLFLWWWCWWRGNSNDDNEQQVNLASDWCFPSKASKWRNLFSLLVMLWEIDFKRSRGSFHSERKATITDPTIQYWCDGDNHKCDRTPPLVSAEHNGNSVSYAPSSTTGCFAPHVTCCC